MNGVLGSLKKGYKAVKLRIRFNQRADLEMIKLVKGNISENIKLMVDANVAWGADLGLGKKREGERWVLVDIWEKY